MIGPKALALTAAVIIATAGIARADEVPGSDWMPMDQLIQKLKASGYTLIHKIEADDGRWEGEGTKDAKTMKFHADPRTGNITSERPADEKR